MCNCELDEDEVQYCTLCHLQMEAEISGEVDPNEMAEDQTYEETNPS